jgi:hypothetical protein
VLIGGFARLPAELATRHAGLVDALARGEIEGEARRELIRDVTVAPDEANEPGWTLVADMLCAPSGPDLARMVRREIASADASVEPFDTPALVVHGTEDRAAPFALGQGLAAVGSRATLVPFEGAGTSCRCFMSSAWHASSSRTRSDSGRDHVAGAEAGRRGPMRPRRGGSWRGFESDVASASFPPALSARRDSSGSDPVSCSKISRRRAEGTYSRLLRRSSEYVPDIGTYCVDGRPSTGYVPETGTYCVDPRRSPEYVPRCGSRGASGAPLAAVAAAGRCLRIRTTTPPPPTTTKAGGPEGRAGFAGRSLGGLRCRRGG